MRLWSFHPKYLDNIGLSRAINEGISGYKALTKQQKMWQNHSQLTRFKKSTYPEDNLKIYLLSLIIEKSNRNIEVLGLPLFNNTTRELLNVTEGQLIYEWNHFIKKVKERNPEHYKKISSIIIPEPHPIFKVISGSIEEWEKVKQ